MPMPFRLAVQFPSSSALSGTLALFFFFLFGGPFSLARNVKAYGGVPSYRGQFYLCSCHRIFMYPLTHSCTASSSRPSAYLLPAIPNLYGLRILYPLFNPLIGPFYLFF